MNRNNFDKIPDELWTKIHSLIPERKTKTRRGRPPIDNRRVFTAIVYRLRTGCQWKAIPKEFGSGSAIHEPISVLAKKGYVSENLYRPFKIL